MQDSQGKLEEPRVVEKHQVHSSFSLSGPPFHPRVEMGLTRSASSQKRKNRTTSLSFSDLDELRKLVKRDPHVPSDQILSTQKTELIQSHKISYKNLEQNLLSTNSSSNSHSILETPPNTPTSQGSFNSAISDFPIEDWDFAIKTMDLNFPLELGEKKDTPKEKPPSPTLFIKRRKRREWKPKGLLTQYLRSFEAEAKKSKRAKNFRPQSPPKRRLCHS